ncbi:hypothetical protein POM88_031470 [Heracleum sosnowskyi]|uniref:F-box protein n=1 Tax=Heracleum sosnowskyi TaxID=360622 RepID=A0AAD8HXH7_9APIA|nr:hypothetical protein POM88_031470 [Heracleum sosnowskyi]
MFGDGTITKVTLMNPTRKKMKCNLWSALDPNLLGEILDRLCLADQLRFGVVCKNWLHAHPITPVKKPLLWYLSLDRGLSELQVQLHDPSSPHDPASIQNISLPKLGIPSPASSEKVLSIVLKHNWLFISIPNGRLCKYNLLFSPFTKKVIILPKIDQPCPFNYFTLTSSTQPDSPDCVFFLLDTCNAEKFTIITYCNGDKEWTVKAFDRVANFHTCYCKLVYLREILYIVSPYGQLASYNIVNREFKFESLSVDELFRVNIWSLEMYCYRVFELNGGLMMIHFVPYEKKNVTVPAKSFIRRYDWSTKNWIPVNTLGDKSLFFREKCSQVATFDKDDNGVLSNKIYHFFDAGCVIYSIEKNGDLIELKSIHSNLLEDGGSDLPEYKYKGCSESSGTTPRATYWLEPPNACSS